MYRLVLGMAAFALVGVASGTASAQAPAVQSFPQTTTPLYSPAVPAFGGTIVTPGVAVSGYVTPPVIVSPLTPVIGYSYGYPWYYGRPYYYPHNYHRRW